MRASDPKEQQGAYRDYRNALIAGSISGACGSYSAFIFEATKKRVQSNQALPKMSGGVFPWCIDTFRGSLTFTAFSTPTMVVQQLLDAYCKNHFSPNTYENNLGAFFSGALGGVVSTATENILLRQQMKKIKSRDAIRELTNPSNFYLLRGLQLIMMREAIFGFCYLRGVKQAGGYAQSHWGEQFVLSAQIATGIFCAIISHPFDTIATTMQRYDLKHVHEAISHLLREKNSYMPFFKGLLPRSLLFTTAALVINKVQAETMRTLESAY